MRRLQPALIFFVEQRCRMLRQGIGAAPRRTPKQPDQAVVYVFAWNKVGRMGQHCRMTARGGFNSCRLVFEDGFTTITSRNSIRRLRGDLR